MPGKSPYAAALALLGLLAATPARADATRRFAIVVGNDDGGPETRPLLYAHDDARRIFGVLTRIGRVAPEDAALLLEKSADDVRHAFDALEPRLLAARERGERPALIVFYSGHAKDGALRLGQSSLALDELKQRMVKSAAEVRIGLFDSCRSGALTRTKGARKAPAFDVDAGAAKAARGLVILTSSAADEDSQESDELRGSFFSHHLASGLLGGADSSGDGRVSLSEAYAYAYDRVVAATAETYAGAQHPTFSYDLAGNGDVILTEVAERNEGVVIPASAPAGSYFLVDAQGAIAAEIAKLADGERRVALAPGSYKVKRRLPEKLRIGDLQIEPGKTVVLNEASLRDAPFADDPVKGASVSRRFEPPESSWMVSMGGSYQSFFSGATFPAAPLLAVELELHDQLRHDWFWGFDGALGGRKTSLALPSTSVGYRFTTLTAGVSINTEWQVAMLRPFVGGRLGMIAMTRKFDDASLPSQGYFALTPALVGGLRLQLADRWYLTARLRLDYLYYNVDSKQSLGFLEGAGLVTYDL